MKAAILQNYLCADVYYQITNCYNGGSNSVCSAAQSYCNNNILSPLIGNYDVYDVRSRDPDPYPPAIDPLFTTSFRSKIGAEVAWKGSNSQVYRCGPSRRLDEPDP
jgi:hypothetical protein